MAITGAFIMPHPPLLLPEIGGERGASVTFDSCTEAAKRVAALKPDIIVLTSPHSVMYADYIHISPGTQASGDFGRFGAKDVKIGVEYHREFVSRVERLAAETGLSAGTLGEKSPLLDHGAMVPLYFINRFYTDYKLMRTGLSGLPPQDHYRFGMLIARAARELGKNVVLIASGDLSHKLAEDGPYGASPEGPEFDSQVTDAMHTGDFGRFLAFDPDILESAAECGLRSFIIMAGALDRTAVRSELLSYEGPYGVGYAVAAFAPGGEDETRAFLEAYLRDRRIKMLAVKENEDEYVKLARYALETFIKTKKHAPLPSGLSPELTDNAAGVFVSLKKHGSLRGCIGTIGPVTDSVATEIMRNAVCSATEDPRFDPVDVSELDELVYSVDVLGEPEEVPSADYLDVKRYGVIVTSGDKRGLLLPNLEGVDTVERQVDIARQKARIRSGLPVKLQRFEVVRHK